MMRQVKFLLLLLVLGGAAAAIDGLAANGRVVAWGAEDPNDKGHDRDQTIVPLAAQSDVAAIAAGEAHSVALKNDGTVLAWGDDEAGQVTGTASVNWPYTATATPVILNGQVLRGAIAIAAGGFHTLALRFDGSVVAWGYNEYSQTIVPAEARSGVTAIAAGRFHSVALKNGAVLAWGNNGWNQTTVPVEARSGVTAIAAGWAHTVALKTDGSVVAWGYGAEDKTNIPVAARSGITAIAAGGNHTVALKADGGLVHWRGEIFCPALATTPMAAQNGVSAIAAGEDHNAALMSNGTVVAWGCGVDGAATVPSGLNGVTAIAAGSYHTLALVGGAPLLPFLDAKRIGTAIVLSWNTNAAGFTLQSAASVTPPVTWNSATQSPAIIGTQFVLTNRVAPGSQFYRLLRL